MLKLLLAERVSIRNLHLILEAIAEIAPHVRRAEQIAEHVRMRMAQQICGDLSEDGVLKVLRLGNRWDLAFHQSLKRDAKGEVVEFDIDPRLIEQFGTEASAAIRKFTENGTSVVLAVTPEARPYVRMILERVPGVNVADALGGFDLSDDVVGLDGGPDLGHLGVDDIPEGVLGKISDAHAHNPVGVGGRNPFVFCGVGQVFGNDAHDGPFIGSITWRRQSFVLAAAESIGISGRGRGGICEDGAMAEHAPLKGGNVNNRGAGTVRTRQG